MKAARLHAINKELRLEDIEMPSIDDDQVIVKVKAAGMCYSDIHVIDGTIPSNPPLTLGHEIAGEVYESANAKFSKGDKVLVHFMNPCGKCKYCLKGRSMQCINQFTRPEYGFSADGGYAEYCKVDADRLVRIPDDLPMDFAATLGCAGITAYHAVKLADTELADTVAVYGTGGVGLYTMQIAKASGAKTIAISRSAEKLRLAEELGADYTINASNIKEAKKITDGLGADIIFDFVVNEQSIANSQRIIANGGKIVLVGVANKPISINPQLFVLKELSIAGSLVGTKDELEELVWLASSNRIKSIVSKHYALDEVNHGLSELRNGKIVGRGCILL